MKKGNKKEELKPKEGGKVVVVCAWCGVGQEKVRPGDRVSHGVCPACAGGLETEKVGADEL